MNNRDISLLYSDSEGTVFDFPGLEPAFGSGEKHVRVDPKDLIPLPQGSLLFSLPGRYPVFYNEKNDDFNFISVTPEGEGITAVSSFLASGYLRTYLPAYISDENAPALPLWAYCGVLLLNGEFYVPAMRVDDDVRSDPAIHENDGELKAAVGDMRGRYPENRLVKQLALCASEYRCLCARNFFLGRFEAPVPTTPGCNAACYGCLSKQDDKSGFVSSQDRLDFKPTADEIAQVILHHFSGVRRAVASFGQGCEGEPLLRAEVIAEAIRKVRGKTPDGTINMNTNGSMPGKVRGLIDAGLDSIRISLNSPTEKYYSRYHCPVNFTFDDVLITFETALEAGIFVSVNLFFMPGFTDMETEVKSLFDFLERFPVNMIQARNLNIDPHRYFEKIGAEESPHLGISPLLGMIRERFPGIRIGYYNPPKETFTATAQGNVP